MTNSQGLDRYIPADVKRLVRQRCGFGCVICGSAIIQYDHMTTGFVQVATHVPEDITLLCGTCHQKKTSGLLSLETVVAANAKPKCLEQGFSRGIFDIGPNFAVFELGKFRAKQPETILTINGQRILYVEPPEEPGGPLRLNAFLSDDQGKPVLEIVANEWRSNMSNWDVTVEGRRLSIRRGKGDIVLEITSEPPNILRFDRLQMQHQDVKIECFPEKDIRVSQAGVDIFSSGKMLFENCRSCIEVDSSGLTLGKGGMVHIEESLTIYDGQTVSFGD